MTDLTLKFNFTDRGGAAVYDVLAPSQLKSSKRDHYTVGQIRIPPDPRIAELEAYNKRMQQYVLDVDEAIERVKALPDAWDEHSDDPWVDDDDKFQHAYDPRQTAQLRKALLEKEKGRD